MVQTQPTHQVWTERPATFKNMMRQEHSQEPHRKKKINKKKFGPTLTHIPRRGFIGSNNFTDPCLCTAFYFFLINIQIIASLTKILDAFTLFKADLDSEKPTCWKEYMDLQKKYTIRQTSPIWLFSKGDEIQQISQWYQPKKFWKRAL